MIRFATEKAFPPTATNWGYFTTPETEKLATAVKHAFTPAEMDKAAGELHAALVDQAPFLFVAHDVGPRHFSGGHGCRAATELVYRLKSGE
jgi:peptide/nickel transport system substrate-binding protein